jgi:hypothetical protein
MFMTMNKLLKVSSDRIINLEVKRVNNMTHTASLYVTNDRINTRVTSLPLFFNHIISDITFSRHIVS